MKLAFSLLLLSFLHVSGAVRSQEKVSLNVQSADLRKVLMMIEAQTKYHFLFSERKLITEKKIDLSVKDETVFKVLETVLPLANLEYKLLEGNLIAITTKGDPEQPVVKKDVRGTVTDTTGMPLPGVTIAVKSAPSIGTTTDLNGKYVLDIPDGATVLVYSMIGYDRQEIPVNNRDVIDVQLAIASSQLEETVIVGFGTQKKREVVGAVTTINPKELKVPSSNLTTALAGRLAGVIAYQRSGEPGADNADFFIRGVTTFGYKKDPLILIDGIETTTTDLSRLNVDDIASFSILKDATSTALYGARGANGVILITTKEGVEGKARVSVRIENSNSAPTKNVALADPVTYMRLGNEAVLTRDPLGQLPYSEAKIDNTAAGGNPYVYPATNWREELFKESTMNQRANFNVSGGGKVARYYLAAAANRDNGNLRVDKRNNFNNNIRLNTYSLRTNVNINLTKSTEVGVRLSGVFDDYNGPLDGGTTMYKRVVQSNPVRFPAYFPTDDAHEYVQHIMFGNFGTGNYINPYADMVRGYKEYTRSKLQAQFELKQNLAFITEGLNLHALFNTSRSSYFDVSRFYNPFWYTVANYDKYVDEYSLTMLNPNTGTEYLNYSEGDKIINSTTYLQATANYNRTFNDKHNVSGMLVFLMNNQVAANAGSLQLSLPRRNIGLSGRLTYAYDQRYFFEYDFGYNGTERFYEAQRFGFFPSVGAAWLVSAEPWFKPYQNVISNLKLRATYGLVGNDAIGDEKSRFLYLADVNMADGGRGVSFGTDFNYYRPGIFINRYGNNDITWETATKTNWGVEVGLFNKMNILLDIYTEKRTNILMNRASIPVTMGLLSNADVQANLGEASGKGFDLSIDYSHSFNTDLWLQARGNFTYATSKFNVYEEPDYVEKYLSHVGYPLSQQWGYIAERLFGDDADVANSPLQGFGEYKAGDIKYHDVNGDGQITTRDKVPIGYPTTPEIVYGFGFSMGYKNFDVSAFFQGLARESFWIDADSTAPFVNERALLQVYADDHWSESDRDLYAIWPRLSTRPIANNLQQSTWFMRNGAFLRLKTVELGYSIPPAALRRYKIDRIRIYASGINLLTFSKFKMWDVEMGGNGLGYPVQRVVNIGAQVSF
ncbi:SusC/RagA family TonB-linked outer membrane protein [Chitinophaga sp. GCM10012297]|uniref:TonB-dependent receptor n=1 Tax=Chitinophaga chungangae TaxID=2821488 RepID=A0ABS3YHV3_9BACT|nr:TonB-dependent receptor [Chitinophaga chungangae]MBO9154266.1 TonB-dependent receptor [Chitinophaga chungangae]